MSTRVTLGRVVGVHGVKGWVKVQSHTRPITNLLDYPRWWLKREGDEYEAKLIEGQAHGQVLLAQLSDASGEPIDDRDVAAALVGRQIEVERSALPKLPKGQFYWVDLVGVEVVDEDGASLGRIRQMTSNGAQDVMVLDAPDGHERMIPYVPGPIVKSVDMKARRIVCAWRAEWDA